MKGLKNNKTKQQHTTQMSPGAGGAGGAGEPGEPGGAGGAGGTGGAGVTGNCMPPNVIARN